MYYARTYKCYDCGDERDFPAHPKDGMDSDGGECSCGGRYRYVGETYDQDFVEEQKYNEQQDREYEARHRYDMRD
jgi:hypothetical protein